MRTRLACAALAIVAGAACTNPDSATDLNPEGPPMIRQVRLAERYLDSAMVARTRTVFAFGTHELADPADVHPVDTALAVGNRLRVVMDELLVGNSLEEIACRGTVDDDVQGGEFFGRVPQGATPDDVARCAVADDVLRTTCAASNPRSVCICRRAGGCVRNFGAMVAEGEPVGVLDVNQDGAADDARFIAGAVGIQCGTISAPISAPILVPIDLEMTYWNPSGDQNRPAEGGFDALGPAIVLVPSGPLPTDSRCGLIFGEGVVDKQGVAVCAPPGGDIAAACAPGDVSAFSFGVEPLAVTSLSGVADGQTNVSRTVKLTFSFNAPLDLSTIANVQISPAPPTAPAITAPMSTIISVDFTGAPLAPLTQYTVTLPATITDTFARPLPQARSFRFTTGA